MDCLVATSNVDGSVDYDGLVKASSMVTFQVNCLEMIYQCLQKKDRTMAVTSTLVPEGPGGHFEAGLAIICDLSDPKGDFQSSFSVTSPAERRPSVLHRDLAAS